MSGEGSGSKPRGFILAPARLARPPPSEETDKNATSAAKPLFSGFKASKLKPSGGAIHAVANNGVAADTADTKIEEKTEDSPPKVKEAPAAEKGAVSFTPLSKEKRAENGEKEEAVVENGGGTFVFGQKLGSRVEYVATGGAVFGQLSERVVGTPVRPTKSAQGSVSSVFGEKLKDLNIAKDPTVDDVNSSQKENPLFSTAATATPGKEIANKQDEESSKKSLSEAAALYTESHSNKRKYDEVAVVTGEEEELNVLKKDVKLFLFSGGNWIGKGPCMLRLNDAPVSTSGPLNSRLVMRKAGNMEVVLNTKLWPEMVCHDERPNKESLLISAMDGDEARVFRISASCKEMDELFTALEYRLNQLKTDKAESTEAPEKKAS